MSRLSLCLLVALTLTSGQYGPKVLRHFLEDNDSKVSLGLFLGAYVYALVVLTGYIETDRPHLTVLTGLLYALIGFAMCFIVGSLVSLVTKGKAQTA